MIRAAVIGATGYTGGELLKWLFAHPEVEVTHCTSESSPGKPLTSAQPQLASKTRKPIILEKCDPKKISKDTDVAFTCLPHGASARTAKQFLDRGVKVIDLSADYRLKSAATYQKWYGLPHPHPELLKEAVYGLPEKYRSKIAGARLIANPGCYATTSILTTLPLMSAGLIDPKSIVIDAKSGVSGAGKKLEPKYLFTEAGDNFSAYAVAHHRHMPEIEQEITVAGRGAPSITFVPHLLPVFRGILAAVYATLKKKMTTRQVLEVYQKFYADEPFVAVLPEGQFPELKAVNHTNFCQMGVKVDERNGRVVALGALDNLAKGASSQAVQNMNLMFGLSEICGLE